VIRLFIRYVTVLAIICTVAAATLATVFEVTKSPIAASRAAVVQRAIQTVLPEFDRVVDSAQAKAVLDPGQPEMYPAYLNGSLVGAAVKVTDRGGYGGDVTLMVGVRPDGAVHAIRVLAHKETPGLGSKMGEEKFAGQFRGLIPPEQGVGVKKDGGAIQAITGATISSRCVTRAVNAAVKAMRESAPRLAAPPGDPAPPPAPATTEGDARG
jgi:electron transport complex protein RnfG